MEANEINLTKKDYLFIFFLLFLIVLDAFFIELVLFKIFH